MIQTAGGQPRRTSEHGGVADVSASVNAARARAMPDGGQAVDITVKDGYRPAAIVARADSPLRLVFHRTDDDPCSERVIFSSPRLDRYLAPQAETTIVLPAQPPGLVRFTCAMGRYRGQIELKPGGIPRRGAAPGAPRAEGSTVGAVMLWLCALPVVGLVALLIVGPGGAIVASLVSLPAWIAACRVGQDRSRQRSRMR